MNLEHYRQCLEQMLPEDPECPVNLEPTHLEDPECLECPVCLECLVSPGHCQQHLEQMFLEVLEVPECLVSPGLIDLEFLGRLNLEFTASPGHCQQRLEH